MDVNLEETTFDTTDTDKISQNPVKVYCAIRRKEALYP